MRAPNVRACTLSGYNCHVIYQNIGFLGQGIQIFTQNELWIKITLLIICTEGLILNDTFIALQKPNKHYSFNRASTLESSGFPSRFLCFLNVIELITGSRFCTLWTQIGFSWHLSENNLSWKYHLSKGKECILKQRYHLIIKN